MGALDKEELVAEALLEIEKGASEREAIREISKKYKITDPRIRGTIHSIVFEILRRLNIIDLIIQDVLQKGKVGKLYPILRGLLRYGVYNLKFTDRPPPKITNSIVEKSKTLFGVSISKFTNALLRRIEDLDLANYVTESTNITNLSLKYFHPKWIIKYLINLLGQSEAIQFLQKSLEPSITYIRVNTLKTDVSSMTKKLEQEGFIFSVDQDLPDVIKVIEWKYPIIRSEFYKEGLIYLQDKASALVSHVLNPQEGEVIFDICAAPGSKTMHIGQLLRNTGSVFAIDRSHRRLLELASKLSQYELQNIYVLNADSKNISHFIPYKADKILVDPPCSGTGTFIARPYSKWKLKPKDLQNLTRIQWKLLKIAAKSLKESGEIIYSTCSITLEENEQLIKKFLEKFPEFTLVPVNPFIGIPGFLGFVETQRLFPHLHNTEGFFISKLKKK